MPRIADGGKKLGIAQDVSAVLQRTGASSWDAVRISRYGNSSFICPMAILTLIKSAAKRVANRPADLAHNLVADLSHWAGERCLSYRVKAVAVDDRWPVKASFYMVDGNLCCQTADGCCDLGYGYEFTHLDDLRPREHEYGSPFATDLR
jgi:hypothetical protein